MKRSTAPWLVYRLTLKLSNAEALEELNDHEQRNRNFSPVLHHHVAGDVRRHVAGDGADNRWADRSVGHMADGMGHLISGGLAVESVGCASDKARGEFHRTTLGQESLAFAERQGHQYQNGLSNKTAKPHGSIIYSELTARQQPWQVTTASWQVITASDNGQPI